MWLVLFVHANHAVDVVGMAASERAATAMAVDCAQEQVRQASGEERGRERYTKPKLDGLYLIDRSSPTHVEVRRKSTKVIESTGWITTASTIATEDELVGRYLHCKVDADGLHPKTPARFADIVRADAARADPAGRQHPASPPRGAAGAVAQPPQPWMDELRHRIAGKAD